MLLHFTAASERALLYASGWSNRAGCDELEAESLLLGLLSEPECRAAVKLLNCRIDPAAVLLRWPALAEDSTFASDMSRLRKPFSADVECSLQLATERLNPLGHHMELATEHLLLGLTAAAHDVALWLRAHGLDPARLEEEIYQGFGAAPVTPLDPPLPLEEPPQEEHGLVVQPPASHDAAALRAMDAAANRAREGLRVIEDYARFVLDDGHLTLLCKQLRHDMVADLARIAPEARILARDTEADVGTVLSTSSERRRDDAVGVLRANFSRLQESLRTLEEFSKLFDPALAEEFQRFRYRSYTLQKALETTCASLVRLVNARLYVLVDGGTTRERFERLARSLVDARVGVVQLRDKTLSDRKLLDRAKLLRAITQESQTLFIMNDRADLALLSQADGVHVGQDELSVKDARLIVGTDRLVGVSTHNIEQARQAVLDGANYIGVGPTFPSGTKQFDQFPGLQLLKQVAAEIRLPAFAIGGIDAAHLPDVLAAGVTRVAVSGAITTACDPALAAKELLSMLNGNQVSGE